MLAVMSGCGCAGTPVTPTAWYVGFLESGPPNGTRIVHFSVSPSIVQNTVVLAFNKGPSGAVLFRQEAVPQAGIPTRGMVTKLGLPPGLGPTKGRCF